MLYAVGKGSKNSPNLINLTFKNNEKSEIIHSFIGKGMTFDAGGLNIKPGNSMTDMYIDKGGACAVMGAFESIVKFKYYLLILGKYGFEN